jgi:hypothetical protein
MSEVAVYPLDSHTIDVDGAGIGRESGRARAGIGVKAWRAVLFACALLAILPALGSGVRAQQTSPAAAVIRGENIWLRAEPAEETAILAYLQRGDEVLVTDDATAADGDAFYPIEVDATGETGWVRALAIDPRTFPSRVQPPALDVTAPVPVDTNPQTEQPRRNRNRAARSESDSVAGDRPARGNNARERSPRRATAAATGDINCDTFATQAEAQAYFDDQGWSAANDPYSLDQGGAPGVPCESLP